MATQEVRVTVLERSRATLALSSIHPDKPFVAYAARTIARTKPMRSKVLATAYGTTEEEARTAVAASMKDK